MNASGTNGKECPSETSPLVDNSGEVTNGLLNQADVEGQGDDGLNSGSNSTDDNLSEENELEKPWPATFERSMSILASPTLDPSFIEKATMSPKITPLLSRHARRGNLDRGYHTPETLRPQQFKQIKKIQSLDFVKKKGAVPLDNDKILEQERRALEAHAYRQKLLKKSGIGKKPATGDDLGVYSPGYEKEKISDGIKKHKEMEKKSRDTATMSQCIFNLANVLMGVGMLGLPYICSRSGWLGGFFVTFTFGAVAWWTSMLIARELNGDPRPSSSFNDNPYKSPTIPGSSATARMRPPIKTFPDIARAAFGESGNILLSVVLYFELFACLCIFLVTMGEHMYVLFPQYTKDHHYVLMAILTAFPTALLKTPRLLSYLSLVGMIATIFVVLTLFLTAATHGDIAEKVVKEQHLDISPPYHTLWDPSGLPIAFGLIAYTFSGHALVPSIYVTMEKPQDFDKMINYTFAIVISCCLVVTVSGYYMFGSTVHDIVTVSLELAMSGAASAGTTLLTWMMIVTAFSKFVLTMFPLALGIEEIVAPCIPSDNVMEWVSSLIKMILIFLSLIVAIYVPSFSFICSLVGLICTMIVSCIFPAAAHLKLFGPHLSLFHKTIDWLFIIFGSLMAVVGTIATVKL